MERQQFPVALRGYDTEQVDAYVSRTRTLIVELSARPAPTAGLIQELTAYAQRLRAQLREARSVVPPAPPPGPTLNGFASMVEQILRSAQQQAEAMEAIAQDSTVERAVRHCRAEQRSLGEASEPAPQFQIALRGYDTGQVDRYVSQTLARIAELLAEPGPSIGQLQKHIDEVQRLQARLVAKLRGVPQPPDPPALQVPVGLESRVDQIHRLAVQQAQSMKDKAAARATEQLARGGLAAVEQVAGSPERPVSGRLPRRRRGTPAERTI
ncbi:MAG: DivIVA domain-containing protein [Micromonosporaceae bacterium]|nr:DivIVA domain-containing protein [Micromonosporaceae bacterium]